MSVAITITAEQRKRLERAWMVFGNTGPKHTDAGHKFIQALLETGTDEREFFSPPAEVTAFVDGILAS